MYRKDFVCICKNFCVNLFSLTNLPESKTNSQGHFLLNKYKMRKVFLVLLMAFMVAIAFSSCTTTKVGCLASSKMVGYR